MHTLLARRRPGARLTALATLLVTLLLGPSAAVRADDYLVYESASGFEDVLGALKLGIEERGLYINNVMNMGEMLERTGRDLGLAGQVFTRAESVEFCSAVLSRRMTQENPARVVNCPFIIAVYTLPDQPAKTFVAHRAVAAAETAASPVMQEVAAMLKGLAEGAVAW